jgi:aminoglycoside phosphotransferase (APT) family kinase protein
MPPDGLPYLYAGSRHAPYPRMNDPQQALEQACAIAGLDAEGARLLRLGSNAVYHLKAPVIVRVSRPGADVAPARRSVAVARWLESEGYPAVRAIDVDQPVIVDGYVVTFWQSVSDDGDQFASTPEIAAILATLHRLTAPESLHLLPLDPFASAVERLEANTWLAPGDRAFLTATLARLRDAYAGLEFVLPPGVIHGDASVGNVMRDRDGDPVLIDLDGFATGPREWDLVLTAMYYDSFGWHTREEYEDFARIYGYDVRGWPGYPVLREVREFLMVTWVSQKAASGDDWSAAEATKRITALRTGASRMDWLPS